MRIQGSEDRSVRCCVIFKMAAAAILDFSKIQNFNGLSPVVGRFASSCQCRPVSLCVCVGSCWWAVYRRTVAWLLRSVSWRRPACGASPRCSSWYASSSAASCLRVKRRRCTATRATGRRNGSSGTASISCARKGSAGRVANRPVFPGTSRISGPVSRVTAWVFPGRKVSRIFVKPRFKVFDAMRQQFTLNSIQKL